MLFINGEATGKKDLKYHQTNDFEVYYTGFFFLPGFPNGIDSINELLTQIETIGLDIVRELLGVYFLSIKDLRNKNSYIFIDNSGLFKAYLFDRTISTSLLELFDDTDTTLELNQEALVEFLHFGFVHFENTICQGVTKLEPYYIYTYDSNGDVEKMGKGISRIHEDSGMHPDTFFKYLQDSIKDDRVSLDLTGGTDSRLIVSALCSHQADFELAISGVPGNRDISIGQKISDKIKKEFYPYYHQVDEISSDSLENLFELTDGQVDIVIYQRIYELQKSRLDRDVTMHISGVGGELYKDFWWLQDFPRYNKKLADLSRLYQLRIESIAFEHNALDKSLHATSKGLRSKTIGKLQDLIQPTNSQTYDSIYYYYKMQTTAGHFLTISNRLFKSYAPLIELGLVKFGFNLPRKKRFYNNFHREFITSYCKSVSKIKTDASISCSSVFLLKFLDLFSYGFNLSIRLLKQILRKVLRKTMFQESPNNRQLYPHVRNLEMIDELIEVLQKHNILDLGVRKENINNNLLGKIVTLGLFIRKYENKLRI